MKEDLWF